MLQVLKAKCQSDSGMLPAVQIILLNIRANREIVINIELHQMCIYIRIYNI